MRDGLWAFLLTVGAVVTGVLVINYMVAPLIGMIRARFGR